MMHCVLVADRRTCMHNIIYYRVTGYRGRHHSLFYFFQMRGAHDHLYSFHGIRMNYESLVAVSQCSSTTHTHTHSTYCCLCRVIHSFLFLISLLYTSSNAAKTQQERSRSTADRKKQGCKERGRKEPRFVKYKNIKNIYI